MHDADKDEEQNSNRKSFPHNNLQQVELFVHMQNWDNLS